MNTNDTTAPITARITLGKFKYFAGMSEETNAFTANVMLDGKVIGYADNHGKGGCTHVRFVCDNRHEMEVHQTAIADHIDTLVDAEVMKKETARIVAKVRRDAIKKAQFIKTTTQKGFVAGFKNVTDLNRSQAVAQAKAHPEFKTMVADMTDAEIADWFIA